MIVLDDTQTVFLKDTKGDGMADVLQVIFGTWNQRDTHGGPSNMQYGLDNWVYSMQGYNDSRLTVGGETIARSPVFRGRPSLWRMLAFLDGIFHIFDIHISHTNLLGLSGVLGTP